MSLEKAQITWGCSQIEAMYRKAKMDFDHLVQRSYVWEKTRMSAFIESLILGYPIPPVFAKRILGDPNKRGSNIYCIMDGKQRLSTIAKFLEDEFALTELPPVKYYDPEEDQEKEINISGMKFSELPEPIRNDLKSTTISVIYFDNLTPQEEIELFKRLNAGKPLSSKSKLLASCKDLHGILNLGNHAVFGEMLSDKARLNKNQATIVMKCWTMLNSDIDDISFENKTFAPMIEQVEMTDSEKINLNTIFNSMKNVHEELLARKEKAVARKLYTELHFVSLVPFFFKQISESMMVDWLVDFFTEMPQDYADHCASGTAKNEHIVGRHKALERSFNAFHEV